MKPASLILALYAALFAHTAHAIDIQPGSWKVDVAMSVENTATPPQTSTVCLKDVNEMIKGATDCSVNTTSATGNHVAMSVSCNANGMQMDGTGNLTISPTVVDGTLNLAMHMSMGPAMQTVSTVHAVRLGDCGTQKQ